MITTAHIKNFTVFADAELRFAPGLNVLIGENGCGKSHLLKLLYAVIAASAEEGKKSDNETPNKGRMQKKYADKLVAVCRPETLGRLVKRKQGQERCALGFKFKDQRLNCNFSFATSSTREVQLSGSDSLAKTWHKESPVFLPPRELLTLYPGFISLYEERHLEFEETYRDTCLLLGRSLLRGRRVENLTELLQPIENAIHGKTVLENGRFYLKIPGQGTMEMPLVAEGWRKFAMLAYLIANGSLQSNGYLFWDEPEANLHPKLLKPMAEAILSLAAKGIQVFIASHSLFLMRELELHSQEEKFGSIKQRHFSFRVETDGVVVEQGDETADLETVLVLDEQLKQADRYIAME